jgi:hypothetical protein
LASTARREKRGKAAGRGEICGGAGSTERRDEEEERKGREEADRWGRGVSERKEKKKREREAGRHGES